MMIPAFLLALSATYLGVFAVARRRRAWPLAARVDPRLLTWTLAFVGAMGALAVPVFLSGWRDATEIAWIGARTLQPKAPLQLGGNDAGAVIGWPNDAVSPLVRVSEDGTYAIDRGGGFVSDQDGHYLNGDVLELGTSRRVGDFAIRLQRRWFFLRTLSVRRADDVEIFSVAVSRRRRDRVADVGSLISDSVAELRAAGEADAALAVERWAHGLRLLVPADGDAFRILGREAEYTGRVTLPARWTVRWTTGSLPIAIRTAENRVAVDFLPPWRLASPLPPPSEGAGRAATMTLTARPMPGDVAFVAPLAPSVAVVRAHLPMVDDRFAQCLETEMPFGLLRPSGDPAWEAVTCTRDVEVGPVALRLATVRDLPRSAHLAATLALPLVLLAWGLWLCLARTRPDDRWILCGVVTTVWLLLLYRWLLALRYAADPAFLDALAVKGVTHAAVALTWVPPLLLAVACVWRDQYFDALRSAGGANVVLRRLCFFGGAVAAACLVQPWIVRGLWPNVPDYYFPVGRFFAAGWFALVVCASFVAFALLVAAEYAYDDMVRGRRVSRPVLVAHGLIVGVWRLMHSAVHRTADMWRWLDPSMHGAMPGARRVSMADERPRRFRRYVVTAYLAIAGFYAGAALIVYSNLLGTQKIVQEVLAPAILCWIPVCLLIGGRHVLRPGASPRLSLARACAVVPIMVALAVFVLPVFVDDIGSLVATLSVFFPLSLILIAGGRPFTFSVLPICTLIAALLAAAALYTQTQVMTLPAGIGEAATARVLIWRGGAAKAQEAILFARTSRDGDALLPVHYRRISDAIEHASENLMMAHEGGWTGLGFGGAPTRRSMVRQDTLQYDSTFAFFVLGDSGLVGGVCLLLLFAVPLVLVFISARPLLDAGHALAAVIAAAFCLAALAHAGMNLGVLPFTGRNLPLLSVNSTSDLLLWALLLALMVQALLWRVTGLDDMWADEAVSVISAAPSADAREPAAAFRRVSALVGAPVVVLFVATIAAGVAVVRDQSQADGFRWSGLLQSVNNLVQRGDLKFDPVTQRIVSRTNLTADTVIGQEIAIFNALPVSERLEGTFPYGLPDFRRRLDEVRSLDEYDALMRDLRAHDEVDRSRRRPSLFEVHAPDLHADAAGTLPYVEPTFEITANAAYNTHVSFRTAPRAEELSRVAMRDGASGTFIMRSGGVEIAVPVADVPGERVVTLRGDASGLRVMGSVGPASSRVRFVLVAAPLGKGAPVRRQLLTASTSGGGLRVRAEDIDLRRRLKGGRDTVRFQRGMDTPVDEGDVVEIPAAIAPGFHPSFTIERRSHGVVIGPAWVRGRYVMTHDPDAPLPWTPHLANALLSHAASTVAADGSGHAFGDLTIDPSLQTAAQDYTARLGRQRHGELLAIPSRTTTGSATSDRLPPRVALSIVSMPSGKVLAMGGWPRMQSGTGWVESTTGLVPPVGWTEDRAPRQMRRRYGGDRNFDRLLMGSATKPIIAAAVLGVHPDLNRLLAVRGGSDREHAVFGIPIGGAGWRVLPSASLDGSAWADFMAYLARSDNRFHVVLGVLALAKREAGRTVDAVPHAHSPSGGESMDGGRTAWHRYPLFPGEVAFNHRRPDTMRNLEATPLAEWLVQMFGIGVRGDDRLRRFSFWTGDEGDDLPASAKRRGRPLGRFAAISPEAPQFALQRLDRPRDYVSLLLGGGQNMWANVDFAAAFATAISGRPIVAHIRENATPVSHRVEFTEIAATLRPGLEAVVMHPRGTAHDALRDTGARAWLNRLRASGYRVYAKTGTLAEEGDQAWTSRLVLAIVRWKGDAVERGVVLSLVIERGTLGLAAQRLGEFLVANAPLLEAQLAR